MASNLLEGACGGSFRLELPYPARNRPTSLTTRAGIELEAGDASLADAAGSIFARAMRSSRRHPEGRPVDALDLERETVASTQHRPACPALADRAIHVRRLDSRGPAHGLDPQRLMSHINALYRAARALCRSHHDADDLVPETSARVLRRPCLPSRDGERGCLLQALRSTHVTHRRAAGRRPLTVPILETEFASESEGPGIAPGRELMSALSATPQPYRDAVVAADVCGLSYEQAASHLQTEIGTMAGRLSRGRHYVAQALRGGPSR